MILKQWGKEQGSQKGGDVCFDEFLFFVMEYLVFFCRDAAPANGKTSELIKETIDLTRNDRIHLKNLKSLQQV